MGVGAGGEHVRGVRQPPAAEQCRTFSYLLMIALFDEQNTTTAPAWLASSTTTRHRTYRIQFSEMRKTTYLT